MQVAPTLVPLLKFYFHEEVRKAAVSGTSIFCYYTASVPFPLSLVDVMSSCECAAMPELLRSAKLAVEKGLAQGRNESYVKQLSDYIIPALAFRSFLYCHMILKQVVFDIIINCNLYLIVGKRILLIRYIICW